MGQAKMFIRAEGIIRPQMKGRHAFTLLDNAVLDADFEGANGAVAADEEFVTLERVRDPRARDFALVVLKCSLHPVPSRKDMKEYAEAWLERHYEEMERDGARAEAKGYIP